jgi:short subunit dehydrogenase-like uncharacterized protein
VGPRPIVIYAATGYTGRLIAAELLERGEGVVLAGRDAMKLQAFAHRLGKGIIAIAPAALDDPHALRAAAARGAVLINCAGPFSASGDALVTAAAAAGAHYLDTTGEQDWIRRAFEVHDPMPRSAAVAYEDGAWVANGRRPRSAFVTFPGPIGRQVVARYPTGEIITVPRPVAARELVARGIVEGPDIYGLTAKTITQAAIELAAPGFTHSGALAPAQAVDPRAFLDGLAAIGVRGQVEAPQQARTEVAA